MKDSLFRVFKIIVGIISILIGLVGLLLPILPGWVLIFAGVYLLSPAHGKAIVHWLEEKIKRYRKQHPPQE